MTNMNKFNIKIAYALQLLKRKKIANNYNIEIKLDNTYCISY